MPIILFQCSKMVYCSVMSMYENVLSVSANPMMAISTLRILLVIALQRLMVVLIKLLPFRLVNHLVGFAALMMALSMWQTMLAVL